MTCPTHGTALSTAAPDDVEIACPECRELWLTRGDLYQLPSRQDDDEQPPPKSS
jgi:Zn-finger nucleic acid-binding protein